MIDALYGLLVVLAVCLLAVLPLAVVLPTAPPMLDDARQAQPRRVLHGWRITLSIGRQEPV